jgi:hypothetical protein
MNRKKIKSEKTGVTGALVGFSGSKLKVEGG